MIIYLFITFRIIMSFRKSCHMPFRKLMSPFTLTVPKMYQNTLKPAFKKASMAMIALGF